MQLFQSSCRDFNASITSLDKDYAQVEVDQHLPQQRSLAKVNMLHHATCKAPQWLNVTGVRHLQYWCAAKFPEQWMLMRERHQGSHNRAYCHGAHHRSIHCEVHLWKLTCGTLTRSHLVL